MKNSKTGKYAETLACFYLKLKGYSILDRNHVTGRGTGAGEIDIIAKKKKTIVFIEVKKRKTIEDASYAISKQQQVRIINGAEAFLQKHQRYQNLDKRFDVILVSFPLKISHIKNAWLS